MDGRNWWYQVGGLVDSLPTVVILTSSYGEAVAIDLFGPRHGLPPAYSGHNSYAEFRRPDNEAAATLAIGYRVTTLESDFRSCEQVAEVDNGYGIDNEAQGKPLVVVMGSSPTGTRPGQSFATSTDPRRR